ncbi:hypothetical protein JCM10212_003120 [Sporobolomyces blumeae]
MASPSTVYHPIAPAPPRSASPAPSQPHQPIASTSTAHLTPPPPSSLGSPARDSPGGSTPTTTNRAGPPPKKKRRSKVESACRFCRKSHMACDGQRPCARCVKREIAHLCTDEPAQPTPPPSNPPAPAPAAALVPETSTNSTPAPLYGSAMSHHVQNGSFSGHHDQHGATNASSDTNSMLNTLGLDIGAALGGGANHHLGGLGSSLFGPTLASHTQQSSGSHSPLYGDFNMALLDLANDGLGAGLGLDMTTTGDSEFQGLGLSEFLQSLNDAPYTNSNETPDPTPIASTSTNPTETNQIGGLPINQHQDDPSSFVTGAEANGSGKEKEKEKEKVTSTGPSVPGSPINKTERFLLTAADQKDGSRSDRLARVIHAKFEAGLLRPYNHVAGYTRLMKWMADNMSASSRQRTLHTLSEFRPTFRAIASSLTDLDLVFIEEAFERLLLDYDRVFSSMGIPSCLWRRTGEIYKGNKEFAALVGVPIENLQGGKLAIYELMAEESAVNYWEKYGNIAFDVGQKAVLTSCVLINQSILSRSQKRKRNQANADASTSTAGIKKKVPEEAFVSAAFSFTIRRDSYGIPSMIVGNFLKL